MNSQERHSLEVLKNIFVKGTSSLINITIVFILSLPIGILFGFDLFWKIATILIFFLYNLAFRVFGNFTQSRSIGMVITGRSWTNDYSRKRRLLYSIFYTASFATLFFWVWFPFDIFLLNIFLVQIPFILATGTTLHGWLGGKMEVKVKNDGRRL